MFSARQFLKDHFVNAPQLVAFAGAYGVELNAPATSKWFLRDSLPGDALATLLALLELDRGQPVSVLPYVGGRA